MWNENKLLKSFAYAIEGMTLALTTQRNMRIHFVVALGAMILSLVLDLSKLEIVLVFFSIIAVVAAELFNTAIEAVVDLATSDYHPLAKIAKDVAAAAVLLTAVHAVIVGFFVFFDKLFPLRLRDLDDTGEMAVYVAFIPLGMLVLLLISWRAYSRSKKQG
ncbi:diacylglycerol kinase [Tumebacillus sp. BK434]|uniref:diacylglycerol kinase n=1 Tax=Tumebacillus sp. BK434 TaxID=2512169 RepID=UPI0010D8FBC8|nr:diacylglycerol kinase [Tumebacillus sp. BK434]TCP53324.1 diacylglycerol kinase [Tumebacillus sp. BK434]